jgi:ribose-phosphate pyrophosphokinase
MRIGELSVFALGFNSDFGETVARHLGVALSSHEERDFEDGEHKTRPLVSVRGKDVYVVQSLYSDLRQSVNDKLCRLLFFLGALRDASAGRITALVPYLCYARKDRKTQTRDPVTTRYVARLFEAVEIDRLVTLDVHNLAAFQNAFRCQTDHLEAKKLFVDYFVSIVRDEAVVVVSPDVGGVKRAEQFRGSLSRALNNDVAMAFMEKQRSGGVVRGETVVGDLRDRVAIIIDDLISTGTTLSRAATACLEQGAKKIFAAASHGIFVGKAQTVMANPAFEKIVVTNTMPPFRLEPDLVKEKLVVLDAAKLFAEAVQQIHSGGSIVDILVD